MQQDFQPEQQRPQRLTKYMRDALNKFCVATCGRFSSGVQLTHRVLTFLNELNGRFDNQVVEKTFYNSPRGILCLQIETWFLGGEGFEPGIYEVPTNQTDLAD
ncbi:MAG: hypothetical protein ACJ8LL_07030 [Candidatus Udaeobacter sp.]